MAVRKSKRRQGNLIERIDDFLDEWEDRKGKRISDATFGWAFDNPGFIKTLRGGGYPRPPSIEKAETFMIQTRAQWAVEDRAAPKRPRKRG